MSQAETKGFFDAVSDRKKKADEVKQQQKRLDNALRSVMGTKEGRKAVSWMLGFTAQDQSISFNDSIKMAIASGRRDVGLDILSRLRAVCPELVALMDKESQE